MNLMGDINSGRQANTWRVVDSGHECMTKEEWGGLLRDWVPPGLDMIPSVPVPNVSASEENRRVVNESGRAWARQRHRRIAFCGRDLVSDDHDHVH